MMFRGRQVATANCRLLISANRRHFFFIDNHQQSQLNNQIQRRQQFSSLNLLASNGGKKEQKQYTQVGGNNNNKMLFEQKRFFATDETSEWLEEKEQQQIENASSNEEQKFPLGNLDKKSLRLTNTVVLYVNLRQGNIKKFFQLDRVYTDEQGRGVPTPFPKLTLEVAYQVVSAMDDLLRTLATKHREMGSSSEPLIPSVLESQRINGPYFDFQLKIIRLGGNNSNAYEFKISTIKTVQEHIERELRFPIRVLPWLRHTMAQMLVEHDGSQQLGPAPPELPESILQARPIVAQNRPQLLNQQHATGNFPTNNQSAFNKQQQNDQSEASQQQMLLQLVQQQLQQIQQLQQQQQQSLPNYSFQQPQPQYQQFMAPAPNSSLVQLAANQQQQQLAQLRAQLAQLEAAVAATTAMSMTNPPLQYHQQQQNAVIPVGFVQPQLQPPLPFYGGQQQQQFPLPPPPFLPFGSSPLPLQQPAPVNIQQNQNAAAASTAALLNQLQQLLMMAGQMNQPQQGRKATMTTTTNQQNAFPTKRPANQQQQQTAAGQWNRLPQQPMNRQQHQQQTAGAAGQASRNAMVNSNYKQQPSLSPPPTNKATTAGSRVESVRANEVKMEKEGKGGEKHMDKEEEGKDEDIFELFSEVEALAEETEKWLEEKKKKKPVEMEMEEKAGMEKKEEEEGKVAGDEMTREEENQQEKLKVEVEEDEELKMKKEEEEASVDEVLLKEKMAATAGGN